MFDTFLVILLPLVWFLSLLVTVKCRVESEIAPVGDALILEVCLPGEGPRRDGVGGAKKGRPRPTSEIGLGWPGVEFQIADQEVSLVWLSI